MALQLKYQGQQKSRNKSESTYKQTYYGTEQQIDQMINGDGTTSGLVIGTFTTGKGYLNSWRKSQLQGIFYQLQIDYAITYDDKTDNLSDTEVGKKSATLSVRNIQLPLEHHANYQVRWNHYLYAKSGNALPSWWETLTDLDSMTTSMEENYKWAKYPTDVPKVDADGNKWVRLKKPTMPGVQVYDWAVYVVTISAKYRSATAAGNAVQKAINKITQPQEDFSISGGDWKMDDCSVSYNGSVWIATMTYTKSGDSKGWDKRLYQTD